MRALPVLCLPLLTALTTALTTASSTAFAKGEASTDFVIQTIGGADYAGHTLTIAPYEGSPVSTVERVEISLEGVNAYTWIEAHVELDDGSSSGLYALAMEPSGDSKLEETEDGLRLSSATCNLSAGIDTDDAVYVGLGDGLDTDSDGLCDAGGADSKSSGDSGFVFGTTTYMRTPDGELLSQGTTISGEAHRRIISADLGTEYCHVGVWNDEGLVHRSVEPCAFIGTVYDPGGDPEKEVPKDQHFSRVWSDIVDDWVTKVVWTWSGGGIDISYHYPGLAWVE